jgi:hypothetical protein
MPYASQTPIGGSIFDHGDSTGIGPIDRNPDVPGGLKGGQSFGGLWVVVLIMAAIAFLIFFVMK